MDFKKATDILFAQCAHDDLARTMEVSVASIRQARLAPSAAAHRSPPPGWEKAVADLARQRAEHLQRLAGRLRAANGHTP